MKKHLSRGARAARGGLFLGLLGIASELTGLVIFGDALDWPSALRTAAAWVVAFAIGGVLYSLVLPAFARGREPTAWARGGAGMAAGATTICILFFLPMLLMGRTEDLHGWMLLFVFFAGLVGGGAGVISTGHRKRPGASS